jgi:DNA-binding cell septation regulator SpoVG
MPCRRKRNGTFQDLAHPISNDFRKKIEDWVLDAFERELNLQNGAVSTNDGAFEAILEPEPGNRR